MVIRIKIKTEYWPKPIPTDKFDWSAWIDGEEELGAWFGKTEREAKQNLLEDDLLFEKLEKRQNNDN